MNRTTKYFILCAGGFFRIASFTDKHQLELSRRASEITLQYLLKLFLGWLPRRSIKICRWGGGEYGNIGTVEWIEVQYFHRFHNIPVSLSHFIVYNIICHLRAKWKTYLFKHSIF